MDNRKQNDIMRIWAWATKHLGIKIGVCILLCVAAVVIWKANQVVICTDVSQYGSYTGTAANGFVRDYIESFFPEQIEEFYSDVNYVYKAAGRNHYDFEVYLEFSITDTDTFDRYVEALAPESVWETFHFDTDYQVYVIENCLDVGESIVTDPESDFDYPIERARIRAVLYNTETQTIIFWALGVYDGGGIGTSFLNTFFDRFGIDPFVYEQTADSPYGKDPFGI